MPKNRIRRRSPKTTGGAASDVSKRNRWRHPSVAYLIILIGIGMVVASSLDPARSWEHASHILFGIGEALVIAGLAAKMTDPFLQRTFAEEWGRDVFWAIFNRDAPDSFRRAISNVAEPTIYNAHVRWVLTFDWVEDLKSDPGERRQMLNILVASERRAVCVSRSGFEPNFKVSIVGQCNGSASQFTHWSLNTSKKLVEIFEEDMPRYVDYDSQKGVSFLDPCDKVREAGITQINHMENFSVRQEMRTRLRALDSIPLFNHTPSLAWEVELRGNASRDLSFELFGSRNPGVGSVKPTGNDEDRIIFRDDSVTLPGHGFVVQWRPNETPADGRPPAQPVPL